MAHEKRKAAIVVARKCNLIFQNILNGVNLKTFGIMLVGLFISITLFCEPEHRNPISNNNIDTTNNNVDTMNRIHPCTETGQKWLLFKGEITFHGNPNGPMKDTSATVYAPDASDFIAIYLDSIKAFKFNIDTMSVNSKITIDTSVQTYSTGKQLHGDTLIGIKNTSIDSIAPDNKNMRITQIAISDDTVKVIIFVDMVKGSYVFELNEIKTYIPFLNCVPPQSWKGIKIKNDNPGLVGLM